MHPFTSIQVVVLFNLLFLWCPKVVESQVYNPQSKPARALDATLQGYAYRAFLHPRTGIPFDGIIPPYLTGIQVSAMRLRSGSLFHRGVQTFKEFRIPVGLREQPYVERLVMVYHNLGNWTTTYYTLPGYTYLAPVLGLLAYNGSDLSATNLPELDMWASDEAIIIKFGRITAIPDGLVAKCVWFDLHGQVNFTNLESGNECWTFEQGHFSIVVENDSPTVPAPREPVPPAPPEAPAPSSRTKRNDSMVWAMVGSISGGIALLVLLGLLILWAWRYKKRKRMRELERAADAGEALRMTRVGSMRAPFALSTRTMPNIEHDFSV
ncbi:putative concanavalin A-like lectin/glucanase domain-containing protein [Tanacetum coccineum]|uniref:Concanavalin A-like lectin/glucanase domain-containing protein n=1 Tax=Tanacetum coccineum TaxID=301880 RepID=A0ABQ5CVR4_9ASTR